jgi:hypothetical protein
MRRLKNSYLRIKRVRGVYDEPSNPWTIRAPFDKLRVNGRRDERVFTDHGESREARDRTIPLTMDETFIF